jgi:hypothetical protein
MKKLLLALMALPFIAAAQEKNVITVDRYWPKAEKVQAFEKALAAHAQKYHRGDLQWRVFTVQSGPDAGAYQVVEGPTSWEALDKRGDISKAHNDDWLTTVQPYLTDKVSTFYLTFRQDLSTVELTDYSDKISVQHVFVKPGYVGDMQTMIQSLKKTWMENNQHVAVYETSSSGEPQFIYVTRYKNGLGDRVALGKTPMSVMFAKANNGEAAWNVYIQFVKQAVDRQYGEMLFYKPELSSK